MPIDRQINLATVPEILQDGMTRTCDKGHKLVGKHSSRWSNELLSCATCCLDLDARAGYFYCNFCRIEFCNSCASESTVAAQPWQQVKAIFEGSFLSPRTRESKDVVRKQ